MEIYDENKLQGDILYKNKSLDPEKLHSLTDAIQIFETILSTRKWAAGISFTLADISLCQSFCQLEAFDYGLHRFSRVNAWYKATQRELKPYGYEVRFHVFFHKKTTETCKLTIRP